MALVKLNFLFHLKSKINLVTLRKFNSHLQYYKIDLSFSIKLQEINKQESKIKRIKIMKRKNTKSWNYENIYIYIT